MGGDCGSFVVNGDETYDFELLFSGWGGNLDLIANFAIEERFADRRGGGDEAFFGVGLLGAHKAVLDLNVALGIEHDDPRAVARAIPGDVAQIEHAEIAHTLFELGDARVHIALALLSEFVLGVFGEIAVGASDGDLLRKLDAELVLQRGDLVLKLLLDLLQWVGHGYQCVRLGGEVRLLEVV